MKPNVLITGASSEIGNALLKEIVAETDSDLILTVHSRHAPSIDCNFDIYAMDLSTHAGIDLLCKAIIDKEITHYIQLQGNSTIEDTLENQTYSSLDFNLNVNLLSSVHIIKTIITKMKTNNFGRIVLMNTASSNHGGGISSFGYGMAKHGVNFLTKYLAKYYTQYNILTNCVSPGLIETGFHERIMQKSKDEMKKRKISVRLGRAGQPQDVAKLIFKLSFENEFISGENVKIDGADFI